MPKAGTRSLAHALGAHPDVFLPYVDCPRYFLKLDIDTSKARFFRVTQTEDEYLSLFDQGRGARYRCDASVEYMFHRESMMRLREASPDARLIVVLRDPVERAYSHYLNDVREGFEKRSFVEAIRDQLNDPWKQQWPSRYVAYGHYVDGLKDAREIFGSRLLVLFFEEVVADGDGALSQLAEFLDLDRGALPGELGHRNAAAMPRNELARRVMGSGSIRRIARLLAPAGMRHAVRGALVGAEPPRMDDVARDLLVKEYIDGRAALGEILGREPAWSFG